jgi:ferredoxin
MSHIIGKECVSICDTGCVDVCPVECIHGPFDLEGNGAEVEKLREEGKLEGLQLYIDPIVCIDCGACVDACPPEAIYETEDDCITAEGDDNSVINNYEFFNQEWESQ